MRDIEFESLGELLGIVEKTCKEENVDIQYGTWNVTWVPVEKDGNELDNKRNEQIECYRFKVGDYILENFYNIEEDWFYDLKLITCEKV